MKLRAFIIILILIALAYNYRGGFFVMYGVIGGWQYEAGDLPHALESYERAKQYVGGSGSASEIDYNTANTLYKKKSYGQAAKLYAGIRTNDLELERMRTYNLGNAHYRIGEDISGSGRIDAWRQSLASYEQSLKVAENKNTRENYEFVKKKLAEESKRQEEERKQEEEKKNEKDSKENTSSGKTSESKDEKNSSGGGESGSWSGKSSDTPKEKEKSEKGSGSGSASSSPQSGQTWSNQGGYNTIAGGTGTKNKPLSADEARELEQYGASLREFQKQNGKYLHPDGENPSGTNGFMDQFFSNPMLQDMIPGNDTERDW